MFYEIKFNAQCSRAIDFFDVNGGKQFQEKFKMFCINADKILPILEICSRHISLRLFLYQFYEYCINFFINSIINSRKRFYIYLFMSFQLYLNIKASFFSLFFRGQRMPLCIAQTGIYLYLE